MSIFLEKDFYKISHPDQYPDGVTQVFSNWTGRYGQNPEGWYAHVGVQRFVLKKLLHEFQDKFFNVPLSSIIDEYRTVCKECLGNSNPRVSHIEQLHEYGRLPLTIYSLPEGTKVPYGVASMVLTNTHKDFAWFPGSLETMMSMNLWKPCTSATTAYRFRKLFEKYAKLAGEDDLSFVEYQGHDFSMRGMSGLEDAIQSGIGHLLAFKGTDTIPAILDAVYYYGAPYNCGTSIPATEHSVMCAYGPEDEQETFKRLITQVYPEGPVSIVSDTWSLWKVLMKYVPALRHIIISRNGVVVLRPDSGDPVKIMIGDRTAEGFTPQYQGFYGLLRTAIGVKSARPGKLDMLDNMAGIYGDGMSLERVEKILAGMIDIHKLSPYNFVAGIGSWTYECTTRDAHGLAMKMTGQIRDGVFEALYKDPVTDTGGKKSARGIPIVYGGRDIYTQIESNNPADLDSCAYLKVFEDGRFVWENFQKWGEVRERFLS